MGGAKSPDDLVRAAVRGDPHALEALVRRHYGLVWQTLRRFVGPGGDAEALCQETFLRAIQALPGYRGEAALSTWITRIGLNLAMNEARRGRPTVGEEAAQGAVDSRSGPSETVERGESARLVRDAVDGLPEELRGAVLLTSFVGMTHREAADHLGCPEGTVSWRVFEARRRLKEVLPHGM